MDENINIMKRYVLIDSEALNRPIEKIGDKSIPKPVLAQEILVDRKPFSLIHKRCSNTPEP